MGNMLPCLAHSTTTTTMNTSRQSSDSIELLERTIHIMKRRRQRCSKETSSSVDHRRKPSARAAPRSLRKIYNGKKQPKAGVVMVRVVLTRKEAVRLASLAGERRTAVQLVRELRRMEDAGHADGSPATAWRPALETISEEWHACIIVVFAWKKTEME
ncbi:hypothetical protein E2562_010232 [Oryza meyeriana var. granulata]|uniref:Uncharacterized protein n=1 Tax=Oryza meyeriana var. granulata TaxID=110450 RepID=A0A6G1EIQ3_9ORYZ|nr:hypothetical protein E2562_010232 [Oryza meyeriana var. granulata]